MNRLDLWLTHNRRVALALVAILSVYFVLGNIYTLATPAFEKPDEKWHYAYIRYLLTYNNLPPITTDESLNPARQEAGQPPLYYLLAASAARILGLHNDLPPLHPNPYWGYPAPGTINDNKNLYVHVTDEFALSTFQTILWLRRLSLILGAGTVIFAYGLCRAIGGSRSLSLASAAGVALLPQYLFIATSISNDALTASLSTAALWMLVKILRPNSRPVFWFVFGILAGLALLTKTSALVMPVLGVAAAVSVGVWRRSSRIITVGLMATLGGVLLCTGWWYIRNTLLFNDPLGIGIHFTKVGRDHPLSINGLVNQWTAIEISFWAAFGWGNIHLPDWIYWGIRLTELISLPGLVLILLKEIRPNPRNIGLWVSTLYSVSIIASLIWWTQSIEASIGRLLFPALAPLMILLVFGITRIWKWGPIFFLAWQASIATIAPIYIARAYEPPVLTKIEIPAQTQSTLITFGDLAQLYAYNVSPQRLSANESVTVTLCWQALRTTSIDYSVFIHILGPANSIIGSRETYPGLGTFATSLWQAGNTFCDRYTVLITQPIGNSAVYGIEVGLFDLATSKRLPATDNLGNQIDLLIIDHLKIIGTANVEIPPSIVRLNSNFGNQITLVGYELGTLQSDRAISITFYWQARTEIPFDYTVFLHFLNTSGETVYYADAPPQSGLYPTHWWSIGERVVDTHKIQIPPELLTGTYSIIVGLYQPETGERLPLIDSNGDSITLPAIKINR